MAKKKKDKRVLIMSDPHIGATTGLVPRQCDYDKPFHKPRRKELKSLFWDTVDSLGHIDHVISVGDSIHGPSKGTLNDEALVNEPANQADLAVELNKYIGADSGLLVHGTPWHVGDTAKPLEQEIADAVGYEFHKIAEQHEVNNLIFHVKHKVGGSNSPRTIGNALINEQEAIVQNHVRYDVPNILPNIILRGHRHVYTFRGNEQWVGFILPCLQAWGGNIAVQMTATYYPTVGIMFFDIEPDGAFDWRALIWKLKTQSGN
jgi:hypothetical protein